MIHASNAAAAATAFGIPASVMGLATTAGGSPDPAVTAPSCAKLTGTATSTITVTSCAPLNAQYKSATAPASALAGGSGTLTWSPSKKTTTVKVTFTKSGTSCPTGSTEYVAKGSVTGGTATYTATGQVVSAKVCLSKAFALTLVPGTKMHL
jgi:hypothetical protein